MMTDSGCTDSVEFPGYQADLTPWFQRAAIFTLPSRREGISNALLETQSAGIPAVVSDIPGNRAVVTDGETGMLVPAGNAEDLARALIHLLGNPDVRHRMGKAARNTMTKPRPSASHPACFDGFRQSGSASNPYNRNNRAAGGIYPTKSKINPSGSR
jgi:hypothetical protein